MNKQQFRDRLINGTKSIKKHESAELASVTDPSFAQSGREIVFNPLPYDVKPIYSQGVPADQMQAFDGMYKDKFEAFQAAREFSEKSKTEIKTKIDEHSKKDPQDSEHPSDKK